MLNKELEELLIVSRDQIAFDEVALLIDERLFQTLGMLFKYDADKDQNLLVARDVFLCVDRILGESRHHYMFHVVDKAQKVSYTRQEIEIPMLNYSFSEVEKVLMWIGKLPENAPIGSEVPAWSFLVQESSDATKLKGVLTKVIFETNMQEDIERACEKEDYSFLEKQVLGDQRDADVHMSEIDREVEDFDFSGFDMCMS